MLTVDESGVTVVPDAGTWCSSNRNLFISEFDSNQRLKCPAPDFEPLTVGFTFIEMGKLVCIRYQEPQCTNLAKSNRARLSENQS